MQYLIVVLPCLAGFGAVDLVRGYLCSQDVQIFVRGDLKCQNSIESEFTIFFFAVMLTFCYFFIDLD